MAGTIGLDQVYFVARIASMKSAAENINITAESWSSMGEKADAFEQYVAQYGQLQAVMQNYRSLLLKDIEAIRKMGNSLDAVDKLLAQLWK